MKNEHRGIFVGFLLVLIILSVTVVAIIFVRPNGGSLIEYVGIVISSVIGVLSLYFVVSEYRRARKIEEGQFLFSLNAEFTNNDDIKFIYDKIYRESRDPRLTLINENDITKIVSYLTFLETFWAMYSRGIINIEMVNDLFANRFFMMITNQNVQKLKLVSEYEKYNNLRRLEKVWREYRITNHFADLYSERSLNRMIALHVAQQFYDYQNNQIKLEFRNLNIKDLDSVVTLQDEVISTLENPKHLYRTSKEDFVEIVKDSKNLSCGCFDNHKLVAYAFFTFPEWDFKVFKKRFIMPRLHRGNMYFKVVVVDEAYRNNGIHSSFLEVAKEYAGFYKVKRIIATVHPGNKISNHVFQKSEFELIKVRELHNGEPRNIYEYKLKK